MEESMPEAHDYPTSTPPAEDVTVTLAEELKKLLERVRHIERTIFGKAADE